MGRDKGLVPFLGEPLVRRAVARLGGMADEILVTTNAPENYRFLGLRLEPDLIPERGALGGLYTALYHAGHPLVAVVACDMPFASRPLLQASCEILKGGEYDVVIPGTESATEPFHAVYRRETCLPAVLAALERGLWRADSWHSQVRMRYLTPQELRQHDPQGLAFLNVNDPAELAQVEERARQLDREG